MRKISAFLALLVAVSGALGFAAGFSWEATITSGVFAVALAAAGTFALRGGDLIYLASAWALYLGMNLMAFTDVIFAFGKEHSPEASFGSVLLVLLLLAGVLGLLATFVARHKERLF